VPALWLETVLYVAQEPMPMTYAASFRQRQNFFLNIHNAPQKRILEHL